MLSPEGRTEVEAVGQPLQRTDEWFRQREGKLTASGFGQAAGIAPGSRAQLWRRLTGRETFEGNAATAYGELNEARAIATYEEATGQIVIPTGFHVHTDLDWLGASPDGLVGSDGLVEIKCPVSGVPYPTVPIYYMAQVQGQLEVTNRQWCDFTIWTEEGIKVVRIGRSKEYWLWLLPKMAEFWSYVVMDVEPPRLKRKPVPPELPGLIINERTYLR